METAMDQRLSLITLGVRDVSQAQAFYETLGWHLDGGVDDETDHVAFFQTPGCILALWDRQKLAADSGVTDSGGWGGVTLAYNVRSPDEVDAVLAQARAAGATIARPGAATQGCSLTPTATPGKSPTIPAGPSTRMAEPPSTEGRCAPTATTASPDP
jgi:catechol 2,3-dioxygenase-like lactoylglutathione lyase family enzyme